MSWFNKYLSVLHDTVSVTQVTDGSGHRLELETALESVWSSVSHAHRHGNTTMFVGNGGSAGICSHSAIDYNKNGGVRAIALNDGAALTCLGNDYGFEYVFSKQVEFHGRTGDLLIAISSSGGSVDILNACTTARKEGMSIVTLSGFKADNPLRKLGDVNFYLDSPEYGFVELGHQTIIHAVLDRGTGWNKQTV